MVRIYICEDNQKHLEEIKRHVSYFASFSDWNMKIVTASIYPEKILDSLIVDQEPNIYIFDVDLKSTSNLNGFQLGKKIREQDPLGYLIYLTSHVELSYLTFQFHVNAIDYIEKNGIDDWRDRMTNCLKEIERQLAIDKRNQEKSAIELITFSGSTNFYIDQIIAFEAIPDHKLVAYLPNEKVTILQKTLDQLESELGKAFFRCHRSFLIQKKKIQHIEVDYSSVKMENQMSVPIAYRKRKLLKEQNRICS